MGRKSKFTDKHKRKILEATSLGCTRAIACKYAGISESILYDWMKRGREAKSGAYFDFYGEMQRAEAMSAIRALSTLHTAMSDGGTEAVRAASFLLERRHGYNKQEKAPVEITINHDTLDVPRLLEEVRQQQERLRPIALPVIDLDEE
jgi:transposase-like protein